MHSLDSVIAALRLAFLAFAGAVLICGGATAVIAQSSDGDSGYSDKDVDLDVLIEAIDDYGKWRRHDAYGDVWTPEVADDWRPYTIGQWAHDEAAGWTWVSEEPFGWVVYHYGRWSRNDEFGWFWVPGTQWAPAWVAWREADEHVGWAPLPPEPPDYTGPPYERTVIYDEPRYEAFWVFATYSLFVQPHIHRHIIWHRHHHHHDIYRKSRRGHHARWRHRRIVNRGVSLRDLRKRARRHVRPAHVVVSHRERARNKRHRRDGHGLVRVYRPSADTKPRRAERHNGERRFHNVDDRRANRRRTKEGGTASRPTARKVEKHGHAAKRGHASKGGQAAARRALKRKAASSERRANRGGNAERRASRGSKAERQKVQRHRRATVKRQAKPKAQHRAGRKARAPRKAATHRKVQRKSAHSRRARANRSVRRRAASKPRARARAHAKPRGRAGRPQARRRGGGGHRRR